MEQQPAGAVPPHAFLLRALAEFDSIAGWKSNTDKMNVPPNGVEKVSPIRVENVVSERLSTTAEPSPTQSLERFLGLNRRLQQPLVALRRPNAPKPADGARWTDSGPSSWADFASEVDRHGAVLLGWDGPRSEFELHWRHRAEAWAELGGFKVAQDVWVDPKHCEFWLVPLRRPSWLETPAAAARLLEHLVARFGGPKTEVRFERTKAPVEHLEPQVDPSAPWGQWKAASLVATFSTGPRARSCEELLGDFVSTLGRALSEAPRGFVGLKHFRDRLLLPTETLQVRTDVLKAALDAGVARVVNRTDPKTKGIIATLELASPMGDETPDEADEPAQANSSSAGASDADEDDGGNDVVAAPHGYEEPSFDDYSEGWKHSE